MLSDVLRGLTSEERRATAVPAGRLGELRAAYEGLAARGELDQAFADELLAGVTLCVPEDAPSTGSLVVVATRDPIVSCVFEWQGDEVEVFVPPTYLHLREKGLRVERDVAELCPAGTLVTCLLNAPHKTLAVRSGLATYGRSNVTFIPDFGSFYLLTTVYADVPCDEHTWREPAVMAECDRCTRCVSACPTGAIPGDRFLLRAERCLTHWNEKPPDVPFPEWISPEAHDALIGCMRCQRVCPLNRDVLKYRTSGPRFSESETRTLLEASVPDELGEELAAKLKAWDFLAWAELLPRNLGALLRGE